MAANEKTSQAVAKIAAKGLKSPGTLTTTEIKQLAASALTQVADKPKKKPAKRKPAKKKAAKKKPAARKAAKRKPAKKKARR